jgi:hypothetical protein
MEVVPVFVADTVLLAVRLGVAVLVPLLLVEGVTGADRDGE